YKRFVRPDAGERDSMIVLYAGTLLWGVIGTGTAMAMMRVRSVLDAWWELAGLFSAGTLGLFLLGLGVRGGGGMVGGVAVVSGGGVHGIFLLGTSGEAMSLSGRLRREVIARGVRQVNRRIPVAVGVGDTSLVETIELARFAAESGADAVVVGVPCYLPPSQEELIEYVRGIVGEQPLPVVLYNIPVLTKVGFGVETVVRLAEEPKVVGIKDSGGDLEYVRSVIARLGRADWSILVGVESLLLRAMRCGAHGGVC